MRNIYVVTHAESIHHIEKKVGGWYDTSLTEHGKTQAERTAIYLRSAINSRNVNAFSSDLKRASETAEIICKHLKTRVTLDKRLREMSYGEAEGKPQSWFKDRIRPQPTDGNKLDHRVYEGAESRRELAKRITDSLNEILLKDSLNTIIVTHGFASTFLIMAWMKIPIENMGYCNLPARPCCVSLLYEDDLFSNRAVAYLCSTNHLKIDANANKYMGNKILIYSITIG
jgi:probable phosphoglycerate mutase